MLDLSDEIMAGFWQGIAMVFDALLNSINFTILGLGMFCLIVLYFISSKMSGDLKKLLLKFIFLSFFILSLIY